ncbi:MAG TPA: hypothetical protein VFI41_04545 [Gemmatimonadales bacterium]|nr:hypothetical protein [Gemmatimonadales bacterium]
MPTQSSLVFTPGAGGAKIEEIVVHAASATLIPTTVAGLVYLFLYDATTYHLFDTIPVTAVTPSTTVAPFRASRRYDNLWLPAGWVLRASQSIVGNANVLRVQALGGDL